jgi:hypothetical protein
MRMVRFIGGELVWLWHATFDGTSLCRCNHSAQYRESLRKWGSG